MRTKNGKVRIWKRVLTVFMSVVLVVTGINIPVIQTSAATPIIPYYDETTHKYVYDSTDIFGAATHVHLFAYTNVESSAHTHGNVFAKSMHSTSDMGVRYGGDNSKYGSYVNYKEVSYAQDITAINSSNDTPVFVVGKGMTIAPNGDRTDITSADGTYTQSVEKANFYQDTATQTAIDFDAEFAYLKNLSKQWAAQSQTEGITVSIDTREYLDENYTPNPNKADMNDRYISLNGKGRTDNVFINLTYAEWASSTNPIHIYDVDNNKANKGIVVINIDMQGAPDNPSLGHYSDKAELKVNELNVYHSVKGETKEMFNVGNEYTLDEMGSCRVVYNVYDSLNTNPSDASNAGLYEGDLTFDGQMMGSILVPAGDITVGQVNGTVMANSIKHIGSESHRMDIWAMPAETASAPGDIIIYKSFSDDGISAANSGAFFTLYESYSGATLSNPLKENVEAVWNAELGKYVVTFKADECNLVTGKNYYVKEVVAPEGYVLSTKVYVCYVQPDGSVTYKEFEQEGDGSTTPATCVNVKETTPEAPKAGDIKLIKSFADNDITADDSGAYFALYRTYQGGVLSGELITNAEAKKDKDADSETYGKYVVTITKDDGLQVNTTYYLKEIQAPDNTDYAVNETVYECKIDENGNVTYRIAGSGDAYSEDFPTCVNTKTVVTPPDPTPEAEDIQLIKTFSDNGVSGSNSGAFFGLYDSYNGTTLGTQVGSDTEALWDGSKYVVTFTKDSANLEVGKTYYLKEIKAPDGYTASTDVYECTIDADGDVTYKVYGSAAEASADFPTCVNTKTAVTPPDPTPEAEDIRLIKTFSDNGITGSNSGAFFGLYESYDGTTLGAQVGSDTEALWDGSKYVVTFTKDSANLEVGKTYYLKETTAPAGYDLNTDVYECKIDADGNVTYKVAGSVAEASADFPECENVKTPEPNPIKLLKSFEDADDAETITGARFGLYTTYNVGNVSGLVAERDITKDSNVYSVSFTKADGLQLNTSYYLKEIEAPDGYKLSEKVYECIIDENGVVKYREAGSAESPSPAFPICVNTKIVPNDIKLIKTFSDNGINGTNSGAVFTLYDTYTAGEVSGPVGTAEAIKDEVVGSATEGRYVVTFTKDSVNLEVGKTYYLKETTVPEGYTASGDVYECIIAMDGTVSYRIAGSGASTSPSFPECENVAKPKEPKDIKLIKTFSDDGISGNNSGAFFALYESYDGTTLSDQVGSNTEAVLDTDASSDTYNRYVVTFTKDSANLEVGKTYYLKETTAPAGYDLNTDVYECKIDADGNVTYKVAGSAAEASAEFPECENVKTPEPNPIKLLKSFEDADAAETITGARFGLYTTYNAGNVSGLVAERDVTKDGNVYSVSFTKDDGIQVNTTYYLKETAAPDGYELSDKIYEFVINEDGVVKYREAGSAAELSAAYPLCENVKKAATPPDPTPEAGDIKLIKTFSDNGVSGTNSGAIFALYDDYNGSSLTNQIGTEREALLDTDADSDTYNSYVVSFTKAEGLAVNETYYLKEVTAPTGYDVSEDVYECIVAADGSVTYRVYGEATASDVFPVCVNKKTVVAKDIQLIKTFSDDGITGTNSGAIFTLYDTYNAGQVSGQVGTAEAIKDEVVGSATNGMYVVTFTKDSASLEVGRKYYLKETTVPEGYTGSDDVYECIIDANGEVTYKVAGSNDPASADFPECENVKTSGGNPNPPVPTPEAEDIKLIKTFSDNDITGTNSGAMFALYESYDGTTLTGQVGDEKEAVDNGSGVYMVAFTKADGLTVGKTYYLKETAAPTGYAVSETVYECIIAADGTVTYKEAGSAQTASPTVPVCQNMKTGGSNPNPGPGPNPPTPTGTMDPIVLRKVFNDGKVGTTDGEKSGCFFTLFTDPSCHANYAISDAKDKEAVWSVANNRWEIQIQSLTVPTGATYYLKEVKSPSGYNVNTTIWDCIVAADGSVTYKNHKTGADVSDIECLNTKKTASNPTPTPTPTPNPDPTPTPGGGDDPTGTPTPDNGGDPSTGGGTNPGSDPLDDLGGGIHSPKTGDVSSMVWFPTIVLAVLGVSAIVFARKKEEE